MSTDYQRGYSKGYSSSLKKIQSMRAQYAAAFKRLREISTLGYGRCNICTFWQRNERREWGFCSMDNALELQPDWPTPWANVDCKEALCRGANRLCTHGSFGCVNFKYRDYETAHRELASLNTAISDQQTEGCESPSDGV